MHPLYAGGENMPRRPRRRAAIALLAAAGVLLLAASIPYLPFVHGTTEGEVDRLVAWLRIEPGAHVADLGAGDGTYAIALARRIGPAGRVYAVEISPQRLAEIRQATTDAGLTNVTVIDGAVSSTGLPAECCDALFSRLVYHHLSDARAVNADIFRALRPRGRMLILDIAPRGIMSWVTDPAEYRRVPGLPGEKVVQEVAAAGFRLLRGPETWRGRMYGVLFARP
jgi:predicted methyltransferase